MKSLLTVAFILLFWIPSFSQEQTLDSAWTINGQNFKVAIKKNGDSNPPLNTNLALIRNDEIILRDSLWCTWLDIKLKDINDDGFDDLLIYQSSGARANETYYLFLFRQEKGEFQKVQGFDEWPNLEKTEIKGVLAATILTGIVEYRFFELDNNGELKDLKISVEDKSYDGRGYKKGIRQVKKLEKYK